MQLANTGVIGHAEQLAFLGRCLNGHNPHHAYIFTGPENLGKSLIGRIFAQALLCHSTSGAVPCRVCRSCVEFDKKTHPDFFEISKLFDSKSKKIKKNIGLEQIQESNQRIRQGALLNHRKVMLIERADFLSEKAANALLKTLEEPAPGVVIILCTPHLSRLSQTIQSRTQKIYFYPVPSNSILRWLIESGCERDRAEAIVRCSFGLPGLANQLWKNNGDIVERCKNELLCYLAPVHERINAAVSLMPKEGEGGTSMSLFFLFYCLRDILLLKNDAAYLSRVPSLMATLASPSLPDNNAIVRAYRLMQEASVHIDRNVYPKHALENALIQI